MTHLQPGDKAPFFEGPDQHGNTVRLSDYKGKNLILYFYPKDNTPGCTAEAVNLKENYEMLAAKGFSVVGVSPDSVASHQRFAEKYGLPFPLIADPEKKILNDYGVWGEKKNYGRIYMGVHRTTFVINGEGTIMQVFTKVKTKEHAAQILEEMGAMKDD